MPPSNLRPAIEALLFASDQPLTLPLLVEAVESEPERVTAELHALAEDFRAREAGVELREIAGGWVFVTAPEHGPWVARMLHGRRKMRLSRAALETLAIIAYKQPVTKSEVEAIRGVDASGVLATLLERNLVTVKGRSQVVGRPLLYGTTVEFLNYFGLRDLAELPRPEELRALVAAREPEQLEMLEMDPETGLPAPAHPLLPEGEPAVTGDVPVEAPAAADIEERADFAEAAMSVASDMPESSDARDPEDDEDEADDWDDDADDDDSDDSEEDDEDDDEDDDEEYDDDLDGDPDEDEDESEALDENAGERPTARVRDDRAR